MYRSTISIIITVSAIAIALVHLALPKISIDVITIALLLIAILPWLSPLFKSIELPILGKFEFQDIEDIKQKAGEAGLLTKKELKKGKQPLFIELAKEDKTIALAGLRIELERQLREIAKKKKIRYEMTNIRQIIKSLIHAKTLSKEEGSVILDLTQFLNQVIHGMEVDTLVAEWSLDLGQQILFVLQKKLK